MQSQTNMQTFFSGLRKDAKDTSVGVGDTMCIQTDFYKARGIRPWEKAKFENDIRRQRQQEFYENQRILERMRNKKFDLKPVSHNDNETSEEWEFNESNIKDVVPRDFVGVGNDAWD